MWGDEGWDGGKGEEGDRRMERIVGAAYCLCAGPVFGGYDLRMGLQQEGEMPRTCRIFEGLGCGAGRGEGETY